MRLAICLLAFVPFLAGCQGGAGDDGIDAAAVEAAQSPLLTAAKQAAGDWDKLTPDQQKLFLERTRGNVESAKMMCTMMSGGPDVKAPPKPGP